MSTNKLFSLTKGKLVLPIISVIFLLTTFALRSWWVNPTPLSLIGSLFIFPAMPIIYLLIKIFPSSALLFYKNFTDIFDPTDPTMFNYIFIFIFNFLFWYIVSYIVMYFYNMKFSKNKVENK